MKPVVDLPKAFTCLPNEEYLGIDPNEELPECYFVGPKDPAPTLRAEDFARKSGIFWYDLKRNQVYQLLPTKKWEPCNMTKYVAMVDDDNELTLVGKLVLKSGARQTIRSNISFKDALKLARES